MNKMLKAFIICSILIFSHTQAQSYIGPELGTVASGVIQSTNSFTKTIGIGQPKEFMIGNEESEYKEKAEFFNFSKPTPPEGSNYYEDKNTLNKNLSSSGGPILFKTFNGINMTTAIPPDNNLAAGPNHIMATVNTAFSIWDKSGNLLKSIDGTSWVKQINANPGSTICDPKIAYDHFNNRWIMVWLTVNGSVLTSYWTVSVSHDSSALGTWYSWATPCHYNGSDSTTCFGDYEGVGFDKDCIYISGNQYDMVTGAFKYSKIRIIPKAQLYANTAGSISYWDIWNISVPGSTSPAFTIRPSYVWGTPDAYYLVQANSSGSNFFTLFKITDPITAPALTGVLVPVTTYSLPPLGSQLGGSTIGLDPGDSRLQCEAKYRDGYLWAAHTVKNPSNALYSAIHYVKIDVNLNTAVEDVVYGNVGNWYSYAAPVVDQNDNLAITFSRSGVDEYMGCFYAFKLKSDPPGLSASNVLHYGQANYVLDYSSGKNRWGDYSGICIDPSDKNNFWMISEFAAEKNIWGTYIGGLRLVPFAGVKTVTSASLYDFGNVELSSTSSIVSVVLKNYGSADLIISGIPTKTGPFTLTDNLSYPIKLGSYDSLTLNFQFTPLKPGIVQDTFLVSCNDPNFTGLVLSGRGFQIDAAKPNTFYASSGSNNSGDILSINASTGTGTNLGASLYSTISGISVNPKTKIIYGIVGGTDKSEIVRVNATGGDSYNLFTSPTINLTGIAFDTSGNLYTADRSGWIYSVNLEAKIMTQVCSTKVKLNNIAIDPQTNEFWGTPYVIIGSTKDIIFKINTLTGDTTRIGKTGLSIMTNGIAFDNQGNLFGATGSANTANNFISINKTTGTATLIGSIGLNNITGLAYSSPGPLSVNSETVIPSFYKLSQNYPNPFNPSTTIEYSLPNASNVKVTIYNLLGEVVQLLDNSFRQAGNYKVTWNPGRIASGVYFYELKASSNSGDEFSQMKKMIMLK